MYGKLIGAGFYKDTKEAVKKCVHIVNTYTPNPATSAAYDEAFERWNKAYEALNGNYYTDIR